MKKLTALAAVLALFLTGCAPAATEEYPFAPGEEERLTVYTSHKEEVYGPILKEFQERTGIWTEVVTGGTNELLERIEAEREEPRADVMFGGGVESLAAYEDCFEPYTCAQAGVLKAGARCEGDVWTPFSSLPIVLICNTKLLSQGEVTGWADLLDSRYRGRIALADPTVSGSSYTGILTLLSVLPGDDWELLARLVENLDGQVLAGSGDVVEAVASGSDFIGVTLEETALKRLAQGDQIEIIYPVEGTSAVPDGSALIAGAPHGENAKAFLEFVQSYDVQELVVSQFSRRSVRTDVPDPAELAGEDIKLVDYDVHWAAGLKEEFTRRWSALRGEDVS